MSWEDIIRKQEIKTIGDLIAELNKYDKSTRVIIDGMEIDREGQLGDDILYINKKKLIGDMYGRVFFDDDSSRSMAPVDADDVEAALLAAPESKAKPPENPMSADRVKWEHIHRVFELCNRNVSETARRLKMHRRTLQRILSKRSPR